MHVRSGRFTPECQNALGHFAERHLEKDRQFDKSMAQRRTNPELHGVSGTKTWISPGLG